MSEGNSLPRNPAKDAPLFVPGTTVSKKMQLKVVDNFTNLIHKTYARTKDPVKREHIARSILEMLQRQTSQDDIQLDLHRAIVDQIVQEAQIGDKDENVDHMIEVEVDRDEQEEDKDIDVDVDEDNDEDDEEDNDDDDETYQGLSVEGTDQTRTDTSTADSIRPPSVNRDHSSRPGSELESLNLQDPASTVGLATRIQSQLKPVDISLSHFLTAEDIAQWRTRFRDAMIAASFRISVQKKNVDAAFTEKQVVVLTNLFFGEMMGQPAFARVVNIIKYANSTVEGGTDYGCALRAYNLARDEGTPYSCRVMFQNYHDYLTMGRPSAQATNTNALIASSRLLRWFKSYSNLVDRVAAKDRDVIKVLEQHQPGMSRRGINHSTLIRNYFVNALQITRPVIANKLALAGSLRELVREHGYGILVLLPSTANSHFQHIGTQKIAEAMRRWHMTCEEEWMEGFNLVCEWVEVYIYDKVTHGERLAYTIASPNKTTPLMERLWEAVPDITGEDDVSMEG